MQNSGLPAALGDVLVGIHRLVRRQLRRETGGPRLSGAQSDLLRLVAERPGIGVSAAARELFLAGNSVSTLVNQLTGLGLLRRETSPGDRRSARLYVTDEAEKRILARRERRVALLSAHIERLGAADRAALTAALPALRRLGQGLHEELEGP